MPLFSFDDLDDLRKKLVFCITFYIYVVNVFSVFLHVFQNDKYALVGFC